MSSKIPTTQSGWTLDMWVKHLTKCYNEHYADLDHKDCLELAELLTELKVLRKQ